MCEHVYYVYINASVQTADGRVCIINSRSLCVSTYTTYTSTLLYKVKADGHIYVCIYIYICTRDIRMYVHIHTQCMFTYIHSVNIYITHTMYVYIHTRTQDKPIHRYTWDKSLTEESGMYIHIHKYIHKCINTHIYIRIYMHTYIDIESYTNIHT